MTKSEAAAVDPRAFCDDLAEQLKEEGLKSDRVDGKLLFGFATGAIRTMSMVDTEVPLIDTVLLLFDHGEKQKEPPIMEVETYMRCVELCNLINARSTGNFTCFVPEDGKQLAIFRMRVTPDLLAGAADKGGPLTVLMAPIKFAVEHFPAFFRLVQDDQATAKRAMDGLNFDNFLLMIQQYCKQKQGETDESQPA